VPTPIGTYDPISSPAFQYLTEDSLEWANDSTDPPEDEWDEDYDCPFAQHMVTYSNSGIAVVFSIGGFKIVMAFLLSLFSYRKWKHIPHKEISEKMIRFWKDTMVQLTIFIEFF
jgi:hypothetical protein